MNRKLSQGGFFYDWRDDVWPALLGLGAALAEVVEGGGTLGGETLPLRVGWLVLGPALVWGGWRLARWVESRLSR